MTYVGIENAPLGDADVVFSALPHGASGPWVARARAAGARVIDLSADLRPGHGAVAAISEPAVYGLTELDRGDLLDADLVANPGCYATAVLLGLLPVLERDLVARGGTISVAAASGVTGAGDSPRRDLQFAEVTENYRAYAVGNDHRHLIEMRSVAGRFTTNVDLIFTPHLLPIARGILATMTVPLAEPVAEPLTLWQTHYAGEQFIEITADTPAIRNVAHRNAARISVHKAAGVRRPTLIVTAAIDNLLKGAAGQALQNANVLCGYDECQGLPR